MKDWQVQPKQRFVANYGGAVVRVISANERYVEYVYEDLPWRDGHICGMSRSGFEQAFEPLDLPN